jgi:hypothetical protein
MRFSVAAKSPEATVHAKGEFIAENGNLHQCMGSLCARDPGMYFPVHITRYKRLQIFFLFFVEYTFFTIYLNWTHRRRDLTDGKPSSEWADGSYMLRNDERDLSFVAIPYFFTWLFLSGFEILGFFWMFPSAKPWVLYLYQTWDHIHPVVSTHGLQGYRWWQCIEESWYFIKIGTKLDPLLQNSLQITQYFF